MLVAGKKLMIPNAPVVAKAAPAVAAVTPVKKPVMIHQPGGATAGSATGMDEAKTIDAPVKKAATVYVVASGDTLEKIAKKLAPGHVSEMEKKLAAARMESGDPDGVEGGAEVEGVNMPAVG